MTFILSAARTPIGSFQGSLSPVRSPDLGGTAIAAAVKSSGIKSENIEMCIMGSVLPAGLGQSPTRQAAFAAGLPKEINVLTVNKVCSSGLVSVMLADQIIRSGDAGIIAAGGMESMTNAPYLLPNARGGYRLGDGKIIDSMVNDGLWDIYTNQHMGSCAELCAKAYNVSRKEQDDFAIRSYKKANEAVEKGRFKDEIAPVTINHKKGAQIIDKDEEPGKVNYDKIPSLATIFAKDGTVTAANASSISDGGAALVLIDEKRAEKMAVKPIARIVSHAVFSREPEWFTMAPAGAVKKALEKAKLKVSDIDLFEINEAFSVVAIMAIRELKLDPEKVNVNGGAVALGHPIGASGARILTTLIYELRRHKLKRGIASLCNGGGEATAMVVEAI
ncbi:MAG: thiolase family protein [Deltaproteobacteria bacterium]|nr:thiolase family protein [Deltaproteobacteria bacterium]